VSDRKVFLVIHTLVYPLRTTALTAKVRKGPRFFLFRKTAVAHPLSPQSQETGGPRAVDLPRANAEQFKGSQARRIKTNTEF